MNYCLPGELSRDSVPRVFWGTDHRDTICQTCSKIIASEKKNRNLLYAILLHKSFRCTEALLHVKLVAGGATLQIPVPRYQQNELCEQAFLRISNLGSAYAHSLLHTRKWDFIMNKALQMLYRKRLIRAKPSSLSYSFTT